MRVGRLWVIAWAWISLTASAATFQPGFNQALRHRSLQHWLFPYVWLS